MNADELIINAQPQFSLNSRVFINSCIDVAKTIITHATA